MALSFTPMALSPMIALKKLFIKLLAALLVSTAVSVRARKFYYPIVTTYPYISSPVEPGGAIHDISAARPAYFQYYV